jgi:carbamoyltransferase
MKDVRSPAPDEPQATVIVGVSGALRNATVAVAVDGELRAVCEQERLTRVRGAGLVAGAFPADALEVTLSTAGGLQRSDVTRYAAGEAAVQLPSGVPVARVDHHQAHAAAALYLTGTPSAAVLVCDSRPSDSLSVWTGTADRLARHEWPASTENLAAIYGRAAAVLGFPPGREHELEALARLETGDESERFADVLTYQDGLFRLPAGWSALEASLAGSAGEPLRRKARTASAFQRHVGDLLVQLAADIRRLAGQPRLCLGGGLFYNTSFTTRLRECGVFDDVLVPPNPGNAGVSVGAALASGGGRLHQPGVVSPFLGPAYDAESVKRTLDNCKLSYECLDENAIASTAVDALTRGQLVGWFQGRMEWGHRALGHRSILASPLSPYVLENLNVYLKHRPRHRAYGVSVPEASLPRFFAGPPLSRFMEFEHEPLDPERLRGVLPEGTRTLRVQTVPERPDDEASARYLRLHESFGGATGVPILVNTSFNGFSEPMVCSPRDAIRVFFGSGLDMLVLDRFVIRK